MDLRGSTFEVEEARRLEGLRSLAILDTPREDEFDRLVAQLAGRVGAPVIALSLVDVDRLWFKALFGSFRRQVTRIGSCCTVAIRTAEPLVVEGAQQAIRGLGDTG